MLDVSNMEIFELKYFLAVARHENIHRASERLRTSPAALSKAVSRLEDELAIKLFSREGRGIKLTDPGRLLQRRAAEIVRLEEAARIEVAGEKGELHVVVAGPEVLLSEMGLRLTQSLKKKHPLSKFEFRATTDEEALDQVERGDVHLAIVTLDVPAKGRLVTKVLSEVKFQTCVGQGHPLYSTAVARKTVPVEELLRHSFASPSNPVLGKVGVNQSLDGWRDDEFPRRVEYLTSSLRMLESLVSSGSAVAYLPDYLRERLGAEPLKIGGCPYSCKQTVKLVAKDPKDVGWINQLF